MPETLNHEVWTTDEVLEQARMAVALARKAGADEAVATVSRHRGLEFQWREDRLEKVKEDATRSLGVRLYVDGRYSTHTTHDLDPDRLKAFLDEAVALTRHLQEDPHRRITDPKLYEGRSDMDLDLVDPSVVRLTRRERVDWCRRMHDVACEHEDVVSSTTHVVDDYGTMARVSSNGFSGTHQGTTVLYGTQVTLREGETKRPEDHWFVGGTHLEGLPKPDAVGREALRRALARRGAAKVDSTRTKMVVHPEAAAMLLGRVLGALTAGAIQQRRSFLAEKQGQQVASPVLTVIDDPLLPRGLASRTYDAEGIAARPRSIIEAGVLNTFYVDTYYGRKLGWEPTTGSPSNIILQYGEKDLEGLVRDIEDGILVTSWLGGNANLTSGDFSYGVRGHVVRGGALAEPVSEMNVTGNYLELLQRLAVVGNDPVPWFPIRTPTLVFDDIQFSGN